MIDVAKIRVGDEVTVRARVKQIDSDDDAPIRICGGSWVPLADILTHTPAPREFKPGDRVTWGAGRYVYEFIAQRGSSAIVWDEDYGCFSPLFSNLRHADESE